MQDTLAKKIFAVGSAVAMTMSLVAPVAVSAAPHGAGTNVKTSDGTVWMITQNGTRRAYTSWGAFVSYGFNSAASVVDANSEDLALPVDPAGFIAPQDGKVFCATETKGTDVKGECALITGSQKASFTSASVFTGLGFSFSRAQNGDSSFLSKTSNIDNTSAAHRPGVLVHFSINGNDTVFLVGQSSLMGIPDLATFNSWGYSFADVVPANSADQTMPQSGVMAARMPGQLSPSTLVNNPNNPPVVSGNVTAMLASDTPAASTLVSESTTTDGSQVGADVAHFAFSGTGTVTQVVVKRTGVSSDNSVSNVYLYQGNNRITDAGSFSNGMVTFSNSGGLFTVSGSVTISVRVDVANSISGQTFGAQLASFSVANGSPMSTSISGNLFTIAAISDLATVKLGVSSGNTTITGSGATGGTAGTINAGTMNANLWGTTVTVSQRAVKLSYVQFKQIGSVAQDAVQNLKLYVDGSPVGNTTSIMNVGANTNAVIFDLTGSPVNLITGSHVIELHGDVVKGSSYNYKFTLQTQSDALFMDTSYTVNVPLTYSAGGTILQLSPGTTTVSNGSVSIQSDPTFSATQFVRNASQVTLGQWTMKAYGEDVKVQNLKVVLNYLQSSGSAVASTTLTSGDGFNNLAVYVNGGQVGSSQSALDPTLSSGAVTYTFGTTNLFTIPAGQTVTVVVKGDSVLTASGNSNHVASVRADALTAAESMQGVTSFTLTPSSNTTYTGRSLTVGSSTATMTKNAAYSDQTIASNLTKQKLGSFVIQSSSADGVKVNSLTVTFTAGAGNTINPTTGLANLYLVTPDFPNGTTPVASASTTSHSVNFTVAASQSATVDVYADISNTTGVVTVSLSGSGLGATSSQSVTLSSTTGQAITVGSGTLNTPTLNASSPVDSFVIAGGTNQAAATFNFVATSGSVVITEMDITATTTTTSIPVTSVTVGGVTAPMVQVSGVPRATSTITGLNITVPTTYSGVNVPVTMNLANVGVGGLAGNLPFTVNLTRVKYISAGSTTEVGQDIASNSFILVGSAPTVQLISLPSTTLLSGSGTTTVAQVKISAPASGDITLYSIPFAFGGAGGVTVASTTNNIVLVNAETGATASTSNQNLGFVPGVTGSTTLYISGAQASIPAGSYKLFNVQIPITGTFSASPAASVSTSMGAATGLVFTDVNSNTSSIAARQTNTLNGSALTATYIPNYPTSSVSIHN